MVNATPLSIHVWTDLEIGRWMTRVRLSLPALSDVLNTGHGYRLASGGVVVGVIMTGGKLNRGWVKYFKLYIPFYLLIVGDVACKSVSDCSPSSHLEPII